MKEKENEHIIFLNLIYQNAEMGLIGIDQVLPKVEDEKLAKLIEEQRKEYAGICKEVAEILIKYGAKEETISKPKEIMNKMMSEMMTLKADDKKIIKMMMDGNLKGIEEIQEELNKRKETDEEIKNLAQKLLATEEHNLEEFKKYL